MRAKLTQVELAHPLSADAQALIEKLSQTLAQITGDSGARSADPASLIGPGCVFVLAYDEQRRAVGCGAIRPLPEAGEKIAELKRMYAETQGAGIGQTLLQFLEQQARQLGYRELWLETRRVNHAALRFYRKQGYTERANYGVYQNKPEAICLGRKLVD